MTYAETEWDGSEINLTYFFVLVLWI